MSAPELRSLRRRFHGLLVLRFVPTGLFITAFVLLMLDRGLSLAQIGLGTAAQGLVMLFLELPSGGLADALGRKPVLLLATVISIIGSVVLLGAHSVLALAVASGLQGIFRALDSGPLEAWFIDAAMVVDPDVDIEQSLANESVVICLSIGAGALLGGALISFDDVAGLDHLAAPIVASIVLQIIGLAAIALLMHEPRAGRGLAVARAAVAEVPMVVRDAVGIIRASRLMTALVVGELLWGFGMVAFETLLPPRLVEVAGASEAARILGPTISVAWVISAIGAAMSPALVRRFGAPWTGFGLRLAHGFTVAAMGLAAGTAGLVIAYLATYWVHSAMAPVHYGMVHRGVEASHRATVVSANSLTSQVGGSLGGIALGVLADGTSLTTAMLVGALVLALAAPLYLVGGRGPATVTYDEPVPLNL